MSDGVWSLEELEELAEERGCFIRYPQPDELFVDIDSEADLLRHYELIGILRQHEQATATYSPSPSMTPGRQHVVVTLGRHVKDPGERIMLQALLGSDIKREALALAGWAEGQDPRLLSIFFEKKIVPILTVPIE